MSAELEFSTQQYAAAQHEVAAGCSLDAGEQGGDGEAG